MSYQLAAGADALESLIRRHAVENSERKIMLAYFIAGLITGLIIALGIFGFVLIAKSQEIDELQADVAAIKAKFEK
jgi:hypothetical protein